MKNLILLLMFSIMIISCRENEVLPLPVQTDDLSSTAYRSSNSCDVHTLNVQQDMTIDNDGDSTRQWLVFYYDTAGNLIQHPLVDNVNGTVYEYTYITDSLGYVFEYNIIGDSLVKFNYGLYTIVDCGETILPNTLIFDETTRIQITKSNPVKFETYIDAPLGPNGEIIPIIGIGRPYNN